MQELDQSRIPDPDAIAADAQRLEAIDPELPRTSLLVSSRNRPQFLGDLVESVLRGDEVPSELVIVDQSSAPHPVLSNWPTRRDCEVRYLWTQSVGVSRGRNEAIARARYDVLVIIDDDMLVTRTWLGTLVRTLVATGPKSVVIGRVVSGAAEDGGFAPQMAPALAGESRKVYQGRVGVDVLAGGNMAALRCAFEEVGGFDPGLGPGTPFPGGEDNDLGFRLLEAGYRTIYEPNALTYHRAWRPGSARAWIDVCWNYARGQGAFYAKHVTSRDRYMLGRLLTDLKRNSILLVKRLGRENGLALGNMAWIVGLLYGAVRWRLTQRPG
jgi:cellulose synthase/poly-beta-1,6-N-acetylglucosamine synthase-like glycosyltransferase